MCGIAGVIGSDQGLAATERMVAAMRPRGPDDSGVWNAHHGGITLGNTRLSIVDLTAAGHMPMTDVDRSCWITYNGELYNHCELRAQLERWYSFRSTSDTEVVLAAYLRWGPTCVERLRGMFAFAIADLRNTPPVVFLARDRLGIKPLYWTETDGRLLFASEIKALLASGLVHPVADHQAVWDYLSLGSVPAPRTILEGVSSLEAGHCLAIADGKIQTRRYWSAGSIGGAHRPCTDLADAAVELRKLLTRAVADHLVADVPVGAFLSGGLDSAAVVAIASTLRREPLQTFTVGFGSGEAPGEITPARIIAQRFGTDHTEVLVSGSDVAEQFPAIISAMDQPSIDGINSYFVSQAATRRVKVAMSGLGADELLAGYPHFSRMRRVDRLLPDGVPPLRPATRLVERVLPRRISRPLCFAAATPAQRHARLREPVSLATKEGLFRAHALHRGLLPPEHAITRVLNRSHDSVVATSVTELQGYLTNTLLRDVDGMSMAHSLEVRVPYLDDRLVEWGLGLSPQFKLRRGLGKVVLREALADLLPPGAVLRGKAYFSMPLGTWVGDALLRPLRDALDAGVSRGVLAEESVQQLEDEARRGHGSSTWAVGILAAWLDDHGVTM